MLLTMFDLTETFETGSRLMVCLEPTMKTFRRDCVRDDRKKPWLRTGDDIQCAQRTLDWLNKEEIVVFIKYLEQNIRINEKRIELEPYLSGLESGVNAAKKFLVILQEIANGNKTWNKKL